MRCPTTDCHQQWSSHRARTSFGGHSTNGPPVPPDRERQAAQHQRPAGVRGDEASGPTLAQMRKLSHLKFLFLWDELSEYFILFPLIFIKRRFDYQLRPWTWLSNTTFLTPHRWDWFLFCSLQYVLKSAEKREFSAVRREESSVWQSRPWT